jgi:hypothetical protein
MRTGDILHCRGNSWISKTIMWFTNSKVSHSALFISVWGNDYILDSQKDGTNLRPFDEWVKKYNYSFTVTEMNIIDENIFAVKVMSKCGCTSYDFELLVLRHPISIVWGKLTGKEFTPKQKKNEDKRMVCSEFVAWAHGLDNPERYTPEKLYQYFINK